MREKKPKIEEFDQWDAWNQTTYRTGATNPPKHRSGLIAFLLGLVIFLCGISTALGLMNIHLFRQLNTQPRETEAPLAFAYASDACLDESHMAEDAPDAIRFSLGFYGQTVPEFWCLYQDVPHGVYVMHIVPDTDAELKGVSPGDVLVALDGTTVETAQQLTELLQIYADGEAVAVTLCREGQRLDLTIHKE